MNFALNQLPLVQLFSSWQAWLFVPPRGSIENHGSQDADVWNAQKLPQEGRSPVQFGFPVG